MIAPAAPELSLWLQLLVVVGAGSAVVVALAWAAGAMRRSPRWQATVWRSALLALIGLTALELTGFSDALWRFGYTSIVATPQSETAARDTSARSVLVGGQNEGPTPLLLAGDSRGDTRLAVAGGQTVGRLSELAPPAAAADQELAAMASACEPLACDAASLAGGYNAVAARMVEPSADADSRSAAERPPASASAGTLSSPPLASPRHWWPGMVWAVGTIAVVGWMAWQRGLRCAFRRRCRVLDDEAIRTQVGTLARRLRLRRRVRLLACERLSGPVAFGWLRPTIALPADFARKYGRRQQQAMLAHELAHLAAGDPWWHDLAAAACAALWWQPLAWWARRQLRAASETAADEASLLVPDGPSVLADCLVDLGRRLVRAQRLGWQPIEGEGFRSALGRRVERLLRLPERPWRAPSRSRTGAVVVTLLTVALVVAFFCTAWARAQASLPEGGANMNVLRTSWRGSIAAAALWALVGTAPTSGGPVDQPSDPAITPAHTAGTLLALADGDRKEGDRKDADRKEGDRKDGDRKEGARKEGDVRRDAPREGREAGPRDRERPAREGDAGPRDRERPAREGDVRRGDRERRPDGPSPEQMQQMMQHRRELMELAQKLQSRLRELPPDKDAEAKEIRAKLEQIERELRAMPGGMPRGEDASPARLEEMRRDLKAKIEQLRQQGKHEDASRLEQQVQRINQALERMAGRDWPPGGPRPANPQELQAKIQHLLAAAENLRAVGMNDQAQMYQQLAERLKAGGAGSRPEGHRGEGPRPEGLPPGGPGGDEARAVQQLRGEIQQMHREMQELRESLKRQVEKQAGDKK